MGKNRKGPEASEREYTRREFLTYQLVMSGTPWWVASEAIASTAIEHPEWDMDEKFTWSEWEKVMNESSSSAER